MYCRWNMATTYTFLLMGFLYMFTANAALSKSHFGKQFYIGMTAGSTSTLDFQIDIASKENGNMYLDIPYLNIHRNQSLSKGDTTLTVSNALIRGGTFTENRGIYLSTDVPVAVYVTWKSFSTVTDTYLALPLSSLGTRYTVASYDPCPPSAAADCTPERSTMMIIGAHDNTTVNVTDGNNRITIVRLDCQDVHQLSSQTDISNTTVWSDKPVTVISGTSCAFVPHSIFFCDMLLEQMIPPSAWDKYYIVPPIFPKLGFLLKVFSIKDHGNTTFCLTNISQTLCSQPLKKEYLMGTEPVLITSNASINVVQYGVGQKYDSIDGDGFMTVIPGINNYLNSYYFVIPNIYSSFENRLSIVVPSTYVGGLRLDGLSLVPEKTYSVPDPFSNYTILIISITAGYHELTHTDTNVVFGVIAYGLGYHIGYGFPVGFGLSLGIGTTSYSRIK
ncbi:IgGFc-binding protein-like [Mercenaria mercenaria]|uniref:IgGFc-binding protein-like n=1 Tax=Mercenaria mercenaria TaxID=6596 RepID=UPI00234F9659|nr:IgGFc-binding protein-like [Mercenaria mercenaria]